MAARALDKVTLGFGLVSIPARVYSTSAPGSELSFHWVHRTCGTRVHQQWYCPEDDEVVERADLIKGYEVAKGKLVVFEPSELKALDAVATNTIALEEFAPATAIDPIYFERHYYLGPDAGGEHAYALLREAMHQSGLVGVATYAARGKQYVVVVRPDAHGLVMHQLRYPEEVRGWDDIELPARSKPKTSELTLAAQVIAQIQTDDVDLSKYKDEVKARVEELIAQKAAGETIEAPPVHAPHATKAADLMDKLRASLGAAEAARPAHDGRGARAHRGTRARVKARGGRRASHAHASAGSSRRS